MTATGQPRPTLPRCGSWLRASGHCAARISAIGITIDDDFIRGRYFREAIADRTRRLPCSAEQQRREVIEVVLPDRERVTACIDVPLVWHVLGGQILVNAGADVEQPVLVSARQP